MSCEKERQGHIEAQKEHATAVQRLKQHEAALFGSTSPKPIFLSDQDWDTIQRLEAEEKEAARRQREKARAYEEANRSHR